ncbi:Chloramphenicol acetyltransferase [bioreactor metagenome]|uniref:Chloramphenicol acetyltransferase n=1 Tax=bioreactor metagenome TaxID=1076179 RepID=A0A645EHG4_9ZZZZ|nr:CatA-like O-acetyltransferase [Candidatus Pelethousia sp.]
MEYIYLDMDRYPRKEHFAYYLSMGYPYVGVTANVDITAFLANIKETREPFFLNMLYEVAAAANAVPEFRQRILNGRIITYSICQTSHTVLRENGTFAYCRLACDKPKPEFLPYALEAQEKAKTSGDIQEDPEQSRDLLFISCLPWISYTSLTQAVPFPADSNPRISWGKYFKSEGRILLPLSVLAHHALVDGKHIGDFYSLLSARLAG